MTLGYCRNFSGLEACLEPVQVSTVRVAAIAPGIDIMTGVNVITNDAFDLVKNKYEC